MGRGGVGFYGGRVPKGWGHVDKGVHICSGSSSSCFQRHVCHGMPIPDAAIPALQTLQGQTHSQTLSETYSETHSETSTGLCRS